MIDILFAVDVYVLETLFAARTLFHTDLFILVSEFGSEITIFGCLAMVGLWLCLRNRAADALGLAVSVCGAGSALIALKYLIQRARPDISYQAYIEGSNYSFPSAHAGLSMALYAYLAYLLMQSAPTMSRRVMVVGLPILAILVGFSRLYLGVHYLSDVAAGMAIGLVFNWIAIQVRLRFLR